ncbi:hypothetical protein BDZ89DRAFT_132140 [Hymenopellis radicata]|nr:hypothetical protein BDZ89DRAFT_132140 [Hymenopellis radicata]
MKTGINVWSSPPDSSYLAPLTRYYWCLGPSNTTAAYMVCSPTACTLSTLLEHRHSASRLFTILPMPCLLRFLCKPRRHALPGARLPRMAPACRQSWCRRPSCMAPSITILHACFFQSPPLVSRSTVHDASRLLTMVLCSTVYGFESISTSVTL